MKKRVLSLLLSAVLLLTLIPIGAVSAEKTADRKPSQELVDMIKKMEGFSAKPYWDNSQYSVGYGTKPRTEEDLQRYMEEGITEEEAEELLYYHLENKAVSVDRLIEANGLKLEQWQYDALLSFSYNCGAGWTTKDRRIRTAVIEGWTGNDFLFAMGEWCTSAGNVSKGLIRRRMREANMYLNGVYDMTVPESYCYVLLDGVAGTAGSRVQVFDANLPAPVLATATYDGYTFNGWYTEPYGGEAVTELTAERNATWLYAHWSAGDGADVPQDTAQTAQPVQADENVEIQSESLPVFEQPLKGAAVIDVLYSGRVVHIVEQYTDSRGIVWGKLEGSGWINLTVCRKTEESPDLAVEIIVTTDDVNIRTGPGTDYTILGKANTGEHFTVTQVASGSGYLWGKIQSGWICLKYTNYDEVTSDIPDQEEPKPTQPSEPEPTDPSEPEPTQPSAPEQPAYPRMGTVICDRLRIRSGPSTGYRILGHYNTGDRVEILEVQHSGTMAWGKVEKGWISMDYVTLDEVTDPQPTEPTEPPTEPTEPPTEPTEPPTEPTEPPTEPTEPPVQPSAGRTGTVVVKDRLRIRSGPGLDYDIVGYLYGNDTVTITEEVTRGDTVWGKMEKGWVSMDYIRLDAQPEEPEQPEQPEQPVEPEQPDGPVTGVVKTSGMLRIRSGPSLSYPIVGYLNSGDSVEILMQKTVNGSTWGQISLGWISMDYIELTGAEEKPQEQVMTVTATCLHIRKEAGTQYAIVGYLYRDDRVTVLEIKQVGQTRWARISNGWVSMDYLK